jgi:hypothetical protein
MATAVAMAVVPHPALQGTGVMGSKRMRDSNTHADRLKAMVKDI